jgi:dTDP-glucose 4,6-dehydratase
LVVANPTNNYGPRQSPEKLIPKMIVAAHRGEMLPLYGDGRQQRDWLHVEDCCAALRAVARHGVPGQRYLIGSGVARTNLDVVRQIERLVASAAGERPPTPSRVRHVADRLGHDRRYAVDAAVAQRALHWAPRIAFDAGLAETVRWYLDHPEWTALAEQAVAARDRDDLPA